MWSESDLNGMRAALDLAKQAQEADEVPVGAVAVFAGDIIGRGFNRSIAAHDPTAHAEIVALREAGRARGNYRLNGVTLYVTLEPCAMCMAALTEARISRLVFGAYDERAGAAGSAMDLGTSLASRFEVNGGVLEDECAELLRGFFASRRSG